MRQRERGVGWRWAVSAVLVCGAALVSVGCGEDDPYYCTATQPCGAGYAFCDVEGACEASMHIKNTCIPESCGGLDGIVLDVVVDGWGAGSVTSMPGGIACGNGATDCSEGYDPDTSVKLTMAPDAISTFTGWSGACTGTDAECTVTMSEARSVTASFDVDQGRLLHGYGYQMCALVDQTGNARCWGRNDYGQLGYGDHADRGDNPGELPTENLALGAPVVQITAGYAHTCALLQGGRVRCWGRNDFGQLGYGNKVDRVAPPVEDVDLGGVVVQIGSGVSFNCALLETGKVKCWGFGGADLGYGTPDPVMDAVGDDSGEMPPPDVDLGGLVNQIAVGSTHACAVFENGNLRCWGVNYGGALGSGDIEDIGDDEVPSSRPYVNVGGSVASVSIGYHTCALLTSGALKCWGLGLYGRLGYGNEDNIGDGPGEMPPSDVEVGGPVRSIALGDGQTCVLLMSGDVRCWGDNTYGQLGYGNTFHVGDDELPSSVGTLSVGGPVAALTAVLHQTCALLRDGGLRCWGNGEGGAMGQGSTEAIGDDELPSSVPEVPYR